MAENNVEIPKRSVSIPTQLHLAFSVDKCAHAAMCGEHKEVFDLTGLTDEDITQYLAQTLVIRRQGMMRSKTADTKVTKGSWKVPAPGSRISVSPEKRVEQAKEALSKIDEVSKAKLMAEYFESIGAPVPAAIKKVIEAAEKNED